MKEQNDTVREIRINPIVPSESVLVATSRSSRPKQAEPFVRRDTRAHVATCPFCIRNEHMTPPAIAAYPTENAWAVRVVENLYPVLGDNQFSPNFSFGLQHVIDGYGRHEVIIDHQVHGIAIHEMTEDHLALLLTCYRDRMERLYRASPQLRYVLVFKNYGPAAGGSIPHTHSQVIATPVIPNNVQAEVQNSRLFYEKSNRCIFCALIDEALAFETVVYDRDTGAVRRKIDVGQYVIERGKYFIAVKPFASRYEWEIHILPLVHQSDFVMVTREELADLAGVLRRTMARLEKVLGGVQYNYFIHSLPHDEDHALCQASFHWHLEICPRTYIPTGFELGSGLFVNSISPEHAAAVLRAAKVEKGGRIAA